MSTRLAVITGGTKGVGAAIVRDLARSRQADSILVTYRSDRHSAERFGARMRSEFPRLQLHLQMSDVADEVAVEKLFDVADVLGELSVLVNNAGVLERQSSLQYISTDRWRRVFATNVFGAVATSRCAVERMATDNGGAGGCIVNISSRAAQLAAPNEYVDYAASKAALETFSRGLALEVAARGVRVNVIRPGIIDTEMHAAGGDPDRASRLGPAQPMGRAGTPEEVAAAVTWLVSPAATYITGAALDVSGGR